MKTYKEERYSNLVTFLLWCSMNSGWILSIPDALFGFRCLTVDTILSCLKSSEDMRSVLGVIHRLSTSHVVFLVKGLSVSGNCSCLSAVLQWHLQEWGTVLVWMLDWSAF